MDGLSEALWRHERGMSHVTTSCKRTRRSKKVSCCRFKFMSTLQVCWQDPRHIGGTESFVGGPKVGGTKEMYESNFTIYA